MPSSLAFGTSAMASVAAVGLGGVAAAPAAGQAAPAGFRSTTNLVAPAPGVHDSATALAVALETVSAVGAFRALGCAAAAEDDEAAASTAAARIARGRGGIASHPTAALSLGRRSALRL